MRERKIASILNQNKATFSKSIYLKRKYNLFSLISRKFWIWIGNDVWILAFHLKNKTSDALDDDRAAVSRNGDAYIDKWTV